MKIITIDREFGAGGHSVGKAVAERLGIEFYDRDIIKEAAAAGNLDTALIAEEEESVSRGSAFIRAISPMSYDDKDVIFDYESKAIIKLAQKGPCVILGRCGSAVLKDAGIETLSVFLHADEEHRIKRAGEILNLQDRNKILHAMHKRDVARAGYVSCYTSCRWGDVRDYTMSLDTGKLGRSTCVDVICVAAQE